MEEEIVLYPVCPHRNVPAAFQRFLGPDSGGFERFFPDERMHRVDGTLLIVRLGGRKAMSGAAHALADFNARLSRAWTATAAACIGFARARGEDVTQLLIRTALLVCGSRVTRLPV
jgi:hypothetical protein